jgi:hypothetical protein
LVDASDQFSEFGDRRRLVVVDQFVLEPTGKALVCGSEERGLAPVYAARKLSEVNEILSSMVIVAHYERFELDFGIGGFVVRSECLSELVDELVVVAEPRRIVVIVELGFEMVEGRAFEEGQGEVDLSFVGTE